VRPATVWSIHCRAASATRSSKVPAVTRPCPK
jgi:hypothetical protein